jgi:outer membrane murein-binding lipoprotein Lpp
VRRLTSVALAAALLVPLALTGCGRVSGGTTEPAPAPSYSETVEAPAVDLTELEAQLDDLDALLDDSTSDLEAAKESESLEN